MPYIPTILFVLLLSFPGAGAPTRMGYDAHITRAPHWTESAAHPITLVEWREYLRTDSEMRLDNRAEATTGSGERLLVESPGIAVWTQWNGNGVDGNYARFYYNDSEIVVKNPDVAILRKMHRIAGALKARVQGDDGEVYDANGIARPK